MKVGDILTTSSMIDGHIVKLEVLEQSADKVFSVKWLTVKEKKPPICPEHGERLEIAMPVGPKGVKEKGLVYCKLCGENRCWGKHSDYNWSIS